jgi:EpsI family protein
MTQEMNTTRLTRRRALRVLGLAAASGAAARRLTPRTPLSKELGPLNLEQAIPSEFAGWQVDARGQVGIVNPQQEALLAQLYSQILTRTYLGPAGERVMLSIAYGNDQRDGMQMHYPEVCYPAQGFRLLSNNPVTLRLAGREIMARRLETLLGDSRHELVTYWSVIGETVVRSGYRKKLVEMQYGFKGLIPDGLLFRVSSIGPNSNKEFSDQARFTAALLAVIPRRQAVRLAGSIDT